MNKKELLLDEFPDETFMFADGFDEAIIGVEEHSMRVVYSVDKCIESLMADQISMTEEDAIEHFYHNVQGAYVGEKTPIFCYDEFINNII